MARTPPITLRLKDELAEQVRRNHEQRIGELAASPLAGATVIRGVRLPDGAGVEISHGLGRAPVAVLVTPIRVDASVGLTPGFVVEYRGRSPSGKTIDARTTVFLEAFSFGATVTVDVVAL